jgi:hypothetical protein
MKAKHWILATSVAVATVFLTPRLVSQEEPSAGGLSQERLDQLAARNEPGPEHQILAGLVGKWETKSRYFMQPGQAMLASGTVTNDMILGGRFLRSVGESVGGPVKREQLDLFGFDRRLDEYTLASFDSWGTQYVTAFGYMDEGGKSITLSGRDFDPDMLTEAQFDVVLRLTGPDEYTVEYYEKPTNAPRTLRVETVHTRVE